MSDSPFWSPIWKREVRPLSPEEFDLIVQVVKISPHRVFAALNNDLNSVGLQIIIDKLPTTTDLPERPGMPGE